MKPNQAVFGNHQFAAYQGPEKHRENYPFWEAVWQAGLSLL
jgi:hypothetical protein